VALTPIGERLHADVEPAYRQILEGFARAVAAGRGVDGVLRVGFLGTAVGQFVLQVAHAFHTRYPACEVEIVESRYTDGIGLLHDDAVDVLLLAAPASDPGLVQSPVLFTEAPLLAVSARHPFARRASVTVDDLARDKVLRPRGVPDELDALSVPPQTPGGRLVERGPEFATVQEMLALVGAGRGVFPVPTHASRYDARPDVAYVPITDGPRFEWRLIWRRAAETQRILAFCRTATDLATTTGSPLLAD
jgi:DNA-binding transcriptional LysR family regulator